MANAELKAYAGAMRFSHLGICVSDLSAALAFYGDLLGFEQVSVFETSGDPPSQLLGLSACSLEAVYLRRDGVTIELLKFEETEESADPVGRPMNRPGLTHLSLRVDDLHAMLDDCRRRGVTVLEETLVFFEEFAAGAVFVLDPDGGRVELVQSPGPQDLLPGQEA